MISEKVVGSPLTRLLNAKYWLGTNLFQLWVKIVGTRGQLKPRECEPQSNVDVVCYPQRGVTCCDHFDFSVVNARMQSQGLEARSSLLPVLQQEVLRGFKHKDGGVSAQGHCGVKTFRGACLYA